MSDESTLAALQAQLAALQAQRPAAPAASPWAAPAPAAVPIVGVSLPVKLQTPAGSVRVQLHLPAECAASPAALMAAVESLVASGVPVDAWQPNNSGGSSWGGNRGGSFNRGGGGWRS